MTLREKLIVLRNRKGISQMELANQLGISRQAVSRWESGDAVPSVDKLNMLAQIYGVSLDWLCREDGTIESLETQRKKENKQTNQTEASHTKAKPHGKAIGTGIAVLLGIMVVAGLLWAAAERKQGDAFHTQLGEMEQETVDLPVQEESEFELEWKD